MLRRFAFLIALLFAATSALALDHAHKAWDDLLHKHVKVLAGGNASRVDYAGVMKDHAQLKAVLDEYAKVTRAEFGGWTKAQQQAFLINDYNALTIEKILTRYPNIKSIRDFGTVFGNPWKDKFFTLFGEPATLDTIEHETLRKPGVYDEPRVHFAVVCASIGCPMLRNEAFTADNLDAFYEDGMKRFLSDRTRNRYDPASKTLQLSMIFKWYGGDFEKGNKGFTSVKQAMSKFADQLADKPEDRALVRGEKADVTFLDYDWSLNDSR
jgi:Protein of unknown function, DUF547